MSSRGAIYIGIIQALMNILSFHFPHAHTLSDEKCRSRALGCNVCTELIRPTIFLHADTISKMALKRLRLRLQVFLLLNRKRPAPPPQLRLPSSSTTRQEDFSWPSLPSLFFFFFQEQQKEKEEKGHSSLAIVLTLSSHSCAPPWW